MSHADITSADVTRRLNTTKNHMVIDVVHLAIQ